MGAPARWNDGPSGLAPPDRDAEWSGWTPELMGRSPERETQTTQGVLFIVHLFNISNMSYWSKLRHNSKQQHSGRQTKQHCQITQKTPTWTQGEHANSTQKCPAPAGYRTQDLLAVRQQCEPLCKVCFSDDKTCQTHCKFGFWGNILSGSSFWIIIITKQILLFCISFENIHSAGVSSTFLFHHNNLSK